MTKHLKHFIEETKEVDGQTVVEKHSANSYFEAMIIADKLGRKDVKIYNEANELVFKFENGHGRSV